MPVGEIEFKYKLKEAKKLYENHSLKRDCSCNFKMPDGVYKIL